MMTKSMSIGDNMYAYYKVDKIGGRTTFDLVYSVIN